MFGGLSFLYQGKMTVGIVKEDLAVRIISDKIDNELNKSFARLMDFTQRPMKEFVYVSAEGFKTEAQLRHYIELGLEHAKSKL
jgi:TfoX/Sxy family transcriptional regulator of competence genes